MNEIKVIILWSVLIAILWYTIVRKPAHVSHSPRSESCQLPSVKRQWLRQRSSFSVMAVQVCMCAHGEYGKCDVRQRSQAGFELFDVSFMARTVWRLGHSAQGAHAPLVSGAPWFVASGTTVCVVKHRYRSIHSNTAWFFRIYWWRI